MLRSEIQQCAAQQLVLSVLRTTGSAVGRSGVAGSVLISTFTDATFTRAVESVTGSVVLANTSCVVLEVLQSVRECCSFRVEWYTLLL